MNIEDIQADIFHHLLHLIYGGDLEEDMEEFSEEDSVKSLYEAAHKYDVEDLKTKCVEYLLTSVQVKNVLDLLATQLKT